MDADLAPITRERLRAIKRKHLSLFLPVLSDDPVVFAIEAECFARAGVYALDLYQRTIAAGTKNSKRKAMGKHGQLKAWTEMNDRIGASIDRQAETWKGAFAI